MKSVNLVVTFILLTLLQTACVPVKYTNYFNNAYYASVAENQGKLDSAVYFYTQALKTEPKNGDIYQKRSLVYNKMGKLIEAGADIETAIGLSKKTWKYYYTRAVILERQSLYNQAIGDYTIFIDKADKKAADYYMGYWGRGKCNLYAGNQLQAAEDFSQSIKFNSTDLNLYTWRAGCYYDLGRYADAAKDYETFLEKNPRSYREQFYLGASYTKMGEKAKATGILNKLAENDLSIGTYFKGEQQLDYFDLDLRRKRVRKELDEIAVNLEGLNTTSKSLADINLNTAFEKLQVAWGYAASLDKESKVLLDSVMSRYYFVYPKLKVKPPVPEFIRKLTVQATSFVEDKNYPQAIEYYQRALTVCPYYPLARFNLAMLYATIRDFRSAIGQMNSYMRFAPDAPDIRAAQDKIYEWELKVKN
ncbi:MAG: tetratricopeptide repeat protein [Chitinophagaceae bacterium]|nr:MAG: tetratricopeptide repeat protein [Chitinophagaceae bacterium]